MHLIEHHYFGRRIVKRKFNISSDIFYADDAVPRCSWCAATQEYINYHDDEWGFPVKDDQRLFEKICLEGFQAGLSWRTILEKRENFRKAFKRFDFYKVSQFTTSDVGELMQDRGIIRHVGKIEATINNAMRARELVMEKGSLAAYFWSFEPDHVAGTQLRSVSSSPMSVSMSKDLKSRGWKFVGPTTAYAFMQAMGLVNDHAYGCAARDLVTLAREKFKVPI